MMNSKTTMKRTRAEPKLRTFRNRLNGEMVQAAPGNKTKIIDGVEFLEVIVNGRRNFMRREHLQPFSG